MSAPARITPPSGGNIVETRLVVPQMRCAGCMAKIERGLAELKGVETARVNLSAKRVAVRHHPVLEEADLAEALRAIGFEAQPVSAGLLPHGDAETGQLLRALAVAGFGMMNIMLLSISVWSGADGVTRELFHWVSALIAVPVIVYSGRPFFVSALVALRHARTNMDVPISIGVLLATGLSLYETGTGGEHAYFDGAVMLLFFLLAGRAADAAMRGRTRAGIGALLSRMGRSAAIVQPDGATRRIAAGQIEPGMLMLVAAGEALAADGIVEEGTSALDNAMLTGESRPEPVVDGSRAFAGSVNLLAPVRVRVTAAADRTTLAEIARLMDDAGQSRSRYVRIAERASRLYAPAVHSLAAIAFFGWMMSGAGLHTSLTISIAVLIVTCPCALGLAVPAAQVVATNALIRRGLLVKDGSALERLAEIDIALFDKTGTLTVGEPRPDLSPLDGSARSVALTLAQRSRHPLSRGLTAALQQQGVRPVALAEVREESGVGLTASWDGVPVSLTASSAAGEDLASVLTIGERTFDLRFADPLRVDAAVTMAALRDLGVTAQILSGDRDAAVTAIARRLGLPAHGGVGPGGKLATLEALKAQGHRPLMVGDGLNDGPALAAAHASIAPGTASDISQQAADAVFTGDRLMPVAWAVNVARRTMRIVRQNFAFAIGYNVLAVPLALAGLVTPLVAAVAMSTSSLVVVANSLRLARTAR